jgi:SPP1 gp7 family putative phage head morphogenesis protein
MILKFSPGKANTKLKKLEKLTKKKIYVFDLPAGKTCPYASDCKSEVIEIDGKLKVQDGKQCKFRCYSASMEVIYKTLYNKRRYNLNLLDSTKTTQGMAELISNSLPKNAQIIRLHVGGDFFSEKYFLAWLEVAKKHPNIIFYGYTKACNFLTKYTLPSNLRLTASFGGKLDRLITPNVKSCTVVFSKKEAKEKGLKELMIVASLGDRTCEICSALHGTKVSVNAVPDNLPPFHANCRCTAIGLDDT